MVPDQPSPVPEGNALFRTFFYPWYDDNARERHPDLLKTDLEELELQPGSDRSVLSPLGPDAQATAARQIETISAAATADLGRYISHRPPPSLAWINALDNVLDDDDILRILQGADARDYSNPYLVFTCELGALTADCLLTECPQLTWLYDHPYWESALFDETSTTRIPVFHWAIKRMSSPGFQERLSDKINAFRERGDG